MSQSTFPNAFDKSTCWSCGEPLTGDADDNPAGRQCGACRRDYVLGTGPLAQLLGLQPKPDRDHDEPLIQEIVEWCEVCGRNRATCGH